MDKFDELVNDYTLVGDDGAVIFSSYDRFLEFVEEIRAEERKREREEVLVTIDAIRGMESDRNPMFSEGYDYALGHIEEFVRARGER